VDDTVAIVDMDEEEEDAAVNVGAKEERRATIF
jgi:hypothetical protein